MFREAEIQNKKSIQNAKEWRDRSEQKKEKRETERERDRLQLF